MKYKIDRYSAKELRVFLVALSYLEKVEELQEHGVFKLEDIKNLQDKITKHLFG